VRGDGSGRTQLTNAPVDDSAPALSPNGLSIAFARGSGLQSDLYVMNSDGTDQTRVTNTPGTIWGVSWAPDGRRLVFSRRDPAANANGHLFIIDRDGTHERQITSDQASDDADPNWSPDGTRIAFKRAAPSQNVWTVTPAGTNLTQLTFSIGAGDVQPAWSPDSTKLAFVSARAEHGTHFGIFTMDADGSHVTRLTTSTSPAQEFGPTWSPDGTEIAYMRSDLGEIDVVQSNGSGTPSVLARGGNPDWGGIATGSLDPEFGNAGIVTSSYADARLARDAAPGPAHTLVVAGLISQGQTSQAFVERRLPDGDLDTTFGSGGIVMFSGYDGAQAVAVDSQGRSIVALYSNGAGKAALVRLLPSGQLDATFGSGGAVTVPTAAAAFVALLNDVTVAADGSIVAVGAARDDASAPTGDASRDLLVIRMTANGALDTTFDGDGIVRLDVAGADAAVGVTVDSNGRPVIVGISNYLSAQSATELVRLTPSGGRDSTFAGTGSIVGNLGASVSRSEGRAVALDRMQRLVVEATAGGAGSGTTVISRLLADGSIDSSFGANGVMTLPGYSSAGFALDASDRILAAVDPAPGTSGATDVYRLLADGSADATFPSPVELQLGPDREEIDSIVLGRGIVSLVATVTAASPAQSIVIARLSSGDSRPLDVRAPTITAPADQRLEATSASGAPLSYEASAVDDLGVASFGCVPPSGTTLSFGPSTVTCDARDAAGNSAHSSFAVTVSDTTPPQLSGVPGPQTVQATSAGGAAVAYSMPRASDTVDGTRPVSCSPASGSTFSVGDTTVMCTSVDTRHNTATASFVVTVAPIPAPPSGGGGGGGAAGASSGIPPDLHVDVAASSLATPGVGNELDFVIVISSKNVGGASEATLKLTLPTGYSLTGVFRDRGPGCTGTPPDLTCNVGFINSTTSTHLRITGTVGAAGEQDFTASVSGYPEPELDPTDNTLTVKLLPPPPPAPTGTTTGAFKPPTASQRNVGATLRPAPPSWGSAAKHVRYQWQLCTSTSCRPIPGATRATLKLIGAYAGKSVRRVATATVGRRTVKKISVKTAVRA
jgi:uncharacterized delta-60 repeat protein